MPSPGNHTVSLCDGRWDRADGARIYVTSSNVAVTSSLTMTVGREERQHFMAYYTGVE